MIPSMSFMIPLCLGLLAVAGLVSASRRADVGADWEPPKFCGGMDCPKFEVIQTLSELELRGYIAAKWITTNETGMTWDKASTAGYKTLDEYRGGNNQDKAKVAETVPYLTLFYPETAEDSKVKSFYTIEYFVPYALQESPPAPTTETINWVAVDAQDVWVQTFGGFASETDIIGRAFQLKAQLKQQGKNVEETYFAFAQYDHIVTLINRHNEIWIFSRDPRPSPSSF